jgi:hypothetical protein
LPLTYITLDIFDLKKSRLGENTERKKSLLFSNDFFNLKKVI